MQELYYIPPEDKIFNEVKEEAIKIWQSYDDTYGYASGKIGRIKDIENIQDNFMYIVAMFHPLTQKKLIKSISIEAQQAIKERLI